jgi:hypothetical protein
MELEASKTILKKLDRKVKDLETEIAAQKQFDANLQLGTQLLLSQSSFPDETKKSKKSGDFETSTDTLSDN